MTPERSRTKLGKQPGKQMRGGIGLRGSKCMRTDDKPSSGLAHSQGGAGCNRFGALGVPNVAARPLRPSSCCFPHASPVLQMEAGKQKTAPKGRSKQLISLRKSGAGEGIRTLDPNLGKRPRKP